MHFNLIQLHDIDPWICSWKLKFYNLLSNSDINVINIMIFCPNNSKIKLLIWSMIVLIFRKYLVLSKFSYTTYTMHFTQRDLNLYNMFYSYPVLYIAELMKIELNIEHEFS